MRLTPHILSFTMAVVWVSPGWAASQPAPQAEPAKGSTKGVVPKLWDDRLLASWALPLAGLNIAPNHVPEREYYAVPVDSVRTYPVYHPDFEPKGYQEWLKQQPPKPLIEPDQLKTEQDWLEAGRRVFDELDVPLIRTDDAKALGYLRDREALKKDNTSVSKDGVILGYRWVVEKPGQVRLSFSECSGCHVRLMPDGTTLRGAPGNITGGGDAAATLGGLFGVALGKEGKPISPGEADYIGSGVPWIEGDIHARFRTLSDKEVGAIDGSVVPGTFARFNGGPFYVTKMADLIGVRDRRYLDATGTHRNRGPEDVARYGILVATADDGSIGPHTFMTDEQRRRTVLTYRFSDEVMYALGKFIYSLEPPPNPNKPDALSKRGEDVFYEEGCAKCHDPEHGYTNNKLTPVDGFTVPENHPEKEHIMSRSVHTDPNLALKTRKSTGLYKVPGLRGLWYRGLLEHSGSVATLEDWFDPKRLDDDYVPTGWKGPGVKNRAVPGHEFGLDLPEDDRKALLAFLRTL